LFHIVGITFALSVFAGMTRKSTPATTAATKIIDSALVQAPTFGHTKSNVAPPASMMCYIPALLAMNVMNMGMDSLKTPTAVLGHQFEYYFDGVDWTSFDAAGIGLLILLESSLYAPWSAAGEGCVLDAGLEAEEGCVLDEYQDIMNVLDEYQDIMNSFTSKPMLIGKMDHLVKGYPLLMCTQQNVRAHHVIVHLLSGLSATPNRHLDDTNHDDGLDEVPIPLTCSLSPPTCYVHCGIHESSILGFGEGVIACASGIRDSHSCLGLRGDFDADILHVSVGGRMSTCVNISGLLLSPCSPTFCYEIRVGWEGQ